MKKGISIILVFLIFIGVFIRLATTRADEINITNPTLSPQLFSGESVDWLKKAEVAVELLNKSEKLKFEMKVVVNKQGKKIVTSELLRKQIALIILNQADGQLFEKRIWVYEADIRNYNRTVPIQLKPDVAGEQLDIRAKYWNSFNTFYEVANRPELVVIANKYLLSSKYLDGLPEKSKNLFSEIIYLPYSTALHRSEIINAGKIYLETIINQAFLDIELKKVSSVASKNLTFQLASNSVNQDFVENIILIEHIDPDSFKISDDDGRKLVERVLVIMGLNKERAYRYTGSPAGAKGIAQFIRPTYNTIAAKYPKAKLIKNFSLGTSDHVNAVKAMVLFFDNYGEDIKSKINKNVTISQTGLTEEMLAVAYNGGPNRVTKSINKFGANWLNVQFDLALNARIIKSETLNYIKKFRAVTGLDIL